MNFPINEFIVNKRKVCEHVIKPLETIYGALRQREGANPQSVLEWWITILSPFSDDDLDFAIKTYLRQDERGFWPATPNVLVTILKENGRGQAQLYPSRDKEVQPDPLSSYRKIASQIYNKVIHAGGKTEFNKMVENLSKDCKNAHKDDWERYENKHGAIPNPTFADCLALLVKYGYLTHKMSEFSVRRLVTTCSVS